MIDKKLSQFIEVTQIDAGTAYIPLIQGSPLYNAIITPDNFATEVTSTLNNFYIKVDGTNSDLDILKFNTNQPEQALLVGELAYSQLEGTIEVGMNGGEVKQSLGLELYVRYKASENILNGQLLMYDGTDGNSGVIKLKKATVGCDPKLIYGIATEDATTGGLHFATWYGKIKDINTSMYQAGNDLYQSITAAGALQSTQPAAPYNKASYAKVINAHSSQGTLFVRISRSVSMNDINDTQITSASNGQSLVYDDEDGVWKNSSSLGINDIAPAGGELNIAGTTVVEALEADTVQSTGGFVKPSHDDTEILLAGGGTKEVSDFQLMSEKGQPNGYASLDAAGLVPTTQLPAYVDDVLEFDNLASFPATGETGKIYVAKDTNKTYRWSGSGYIYITSGAVDSVAGKTGVVTLVKADVGLGNVDNTSDLNKPISTATQTALNGKVNNTGNETIAGVKTFSSSPKVPLVPLVDEDAASKAYADGQANASLTLAQKYAENPEDVEVITGEYSAKHYSLKAAQSAAGIADSAEMLIKHEAEINALENTLNSTNINQETTATVTGVDTIALPKTAANTGMQVKMFGQSASEEISFSSTSSHSTLNVVKTAGKPIYAATATLSVVTVFAFDVSKSAVTGEKYYARLKVKLITGTYTSIDLLLRGSTSNTQSIILQTINIPVLNTQYTLSGVGTLTSAITGLIRFASRAYTPVIGDIIEYVEPMLINLTATYGAGNEPTKEQCDLLFANYFEGSDNVLGTGRVRSVGKNLLNLNPYGKKIYTGTLDGRTNAQRLLFYDVFESVSRTGSINPGQAKLRTIDSEKVEFTSYLTGYAIGFKFKAKDGDVFSRRETITGGIGGQSGFSFYDSNGTKLLHTLDVTVTAPANTSFGLLVLAPNTTNAIVTYTNVQLERGNVATTYEPYRESILQLTTPPLRSNGLIKDEIRKGTNGYELIKRVGVGTLGTNLALGFDFNNWGKSALITIDSANSFTVTDVSSTQSLGKNLGLVVGKWYYVSVSLTTTSTSVVIHNNSIGNFSPIIINNQIFKATSASININPKSIGSTTINSFVVMELPVTDGEPISSSITLFGNTANYTLATPTITPIAHAGLLNSNSNGTTYFEPIIADAGVYSTNLTVQLTDYPIALFESIRKYANGTYTELNTATAVIAGDGLSFTHPDLVSGDLVMFTYAYANESIGRSITLTHYDSRFVEADTANGKVYRIVPVVTNGVVSWTAVEV